MSEAAPAAPATGESTETTTTTPPPGESVTDWKAEAEKWKEKSGKNLADSKRHADRVRELETAQRASMTEAERALDEAKQAGRMEAIIEASAELVDAQIRVAAAGRPIDVDTLIEGLDRSKFLGTDGKPNTGAITDWVNRIAPESKPAEAAPATPAAPLAGVNLGQGNQPTPIGADDAFAAELLAKVGGARTPTP